MAIGISLCALMISAWLFRRATGSLDPRKMSMGLWTFLIGLVIPNFFASLVAYYHLDSSRHISMIPDEKIRMYGWMAVQYCLIAMPIAMMAVNSLFRYSKPGRAFEEFLAAPIESIANARHESLYKYYLIGLSGLSVLVVIYTHVIIGRIPLIDPFIEDAHTLAVMRISTDYDFAGNKLIRNILGSYMTPLLSLVAFAYWRASRSKFDLIWAVVMVVASIFIIAIEYSKSGYAFYVLMFLALLMLLGARVSLRMLMYIAGGIFGLIVLMYALFSAGPISSYLGSLQFGLMGRIFISQAEGLYLCLYYFPEHHDFLWFNSLSSFIGEDVPRAARIIMEYCAPQAVSEGTAGVINSLFLGEAWANFGIWGILLSPFWVGAVVQVYHIVLTRGRKLPVKLAVYAVLMVMLPITGGINDFIYNRPLIILLLLLGIPYFAIKWYLKRCDSR